MFVYLFVLSRKFMYLNTYYDVYYTHIAPVSNPGIPSESEKSFLRHQQFINKQRSIEKLIKKKA